MKGIWYWSRSSLRARARSYLGVAVLLALLGGLTLASFAGARRTASAYPRFREAGGALDVQVNAGGYEVEFPETAGQMPGVTDTATYAAFLAGPLTSDGRPDLSFGIEAAGSVDGLYFTHDRFTVTRGRMPDPARHDEVAVNEHFARLNDVRLGRRIEIGVYDPADEESVYSESPPPPADRVTVTVVGIGVFPDEVVQDDTDRLPRMLFTPAFTDRVMRHATYAWTGVRLERGAAGVERFKRDYLAALPEGAPASFREASKVIARTQEAVRPLAVALGVFGAVAAVATFVLVGQALVRLLRAAGDDLSSLRAIGAGPRLTTGVALPGAAVSIVSGIVGALVVAVVLSPLAPIGPLRRVEADPGLAIDLSVLLLGAVGLAVALGAVALFAAIRQAPHREQTRARWGLERRSSIVGAVAAAGLPLPAVAGMRLALEPGGGRTSVPVRAALGGAVVGVIALVASLVFGSSLRSLVDEPRLYGWDWNLTVLDEAGYGSIDIAKTRDLLDREPGVAAWSAVFFQSIDLEGRSTPAIGIEPGAAVIPPLLSGRAVERPDEVVLGATTMADLGKQIGDAVVLGGSEGSQRLRIVGTAVFPTVGPVLGGYTSLGEGAMLAFDRIPDWDAISPDPKALFIRFASGADRDAVTERLSPHIGEIGVFPGSAEPLPVQRPAEIVNFSSMGFTPALLSGVLVLAAVVSLGLTLASGVNRRRRDLAVLKALGFTRREVSSSVVWQSSIIVAVGVAAGVPAGVILGRWLWSLFAERLPVLSQPAVPGFVLAALVVALLVMANLAAVLPARLAGRTPVAAILRSE